MAIKKVLLSKKINNVIYDIFPKTDASVVVYGDTTVSAALAEFANGLAGVYTKEEAEAAIKAESEALYNKLIGVTEGDTTIDEAYDTLKEVAAYINEHGEVAAGMLSDISALKTAVGDAESGLVKAVADLQTAVSDNDADIADLEAAVADLEAAVGDAAAGLVKDVAELQTKVGTLETKVGTLETTVGDAESGLVKAVADLQAAATNVQASETNGNIKVDGEEVVVYTHPETHAATMIVEDDDHQFVNAAEKATIAGAAAIKLVASQDEVTTENDLYMIEITE